LRAFYFTPLSRLAIYVHWPTFQNAAIGPELPYIHPRNVDGEGSSR
jgi:hypothetical protein